MNKASESLLSQLAEVITGDVGASGKVQSVKPSGCETQPDGFLYLTHA